MSQGRVEAVCDFQDSFSYTARSQSGLPSLVVYVLLVCVLPLKKQRDPPPPPPASANRFIDGVLDGLTVLCGGTREVEGGGRKESRSQLCGCGAGFGSCQWLGDWVSSRPFCRWWYMQVVVVENEKKRKQK